MDVGYCSPVEQPLQHNIGSYAETSTAPYTDTPSSGSPCSRLSHIVSALAQTPTAHVEEEKLMYRRPVPPLPPPQSVNKLLQSFFNFLLKS